MAQSVSLWGATYSDVPAIEVPKSGGGMASFTDVTDTTAIASDVLSGKYFYTAAGEKTLGTGSGGGGGGGAQELTGTFTGNGGISVQIPCNFAPDLIYVHGDLSGSASNRGVISITIVKDTMILQSSDTSSSSANETASYAVTSGVSGYVGNSSYCHATYSNSTLTIDTGSNTSANRFTSGITYSYKLLKWTT